jgi:DNA ligase (NAD+)
METAKLFVEKTKSQIKTFLKEAKTSEILAIKLVLDDSYYNSENEIGTQDWQYDMIKDELVERDPSFKDKVGAKIRDDEVEVELPFWLGSMDKIKKNEPEKYEKWIEKVKSDEPFIIMDKLDGISCLLSTKNKKISLYTRGDGKIGKDITYISDYINFIPSIDSLPKNLYIRGELVMSKKNFDKMEGEKVNSRNTVSGLIKGKTIRKELQNVDFVVYEVVGKGKMPKLSEQFEGLEEAGFRVVQYKTIKNTSIKILEKELLERKEKSFYDIDGIIVQQDVEYTRNVSKNPKYAFAYKSDINAETTVIDVEWNISMSGMLKPRVRIKPVFLSGATINYATGYNGSFIRDNKIGPGAVIEITRSGDVIPKIIDVIKEAKDGGKMPDIPYTWGESNVDIFASSPGEEIKVKILMNFMKTMKIKFASESTIRKLVELGFNTIKKILDATKEDFYNLPSFKKASVERLYNNIHEGMLKTDFPTLMAASNVFGFGIGVKRLKVLMNTYPDILETFDEHSESELLKMVLKVEGFSEIMANKIVKGLPKFIKFLKGIYKHLSVSLLNKEKKDKKVKKNLEGKKIVCSGFRTVLDEFIEDRGGKQVSSISKNTDILVVKDKELSTGKIEKAKELGIQIYTIEEFQKKFKN